MGTVLDMTLHFRLTGGALRKKLIHDTSLVVTRGMREVATLLTLRNIHDGGIFFRRWKNKNNIPWYGKERMEIENVFFMNSRELIG